MSEGNKNEWLISVPRVINVAGTLTELGGCWVWPEAIEAMRDVSDLFLDFGRYHLAAGEYIAGLLEVDAAMVTSGAAAGLIQAAAACMAMKNENERMRLPEAGQKSEIIVMRSHRNAYDQALRMAGATFIEIGSGIETHPWELEAALNLRTAAVVFFLQSEMLDCSLPLQQTLEIAHHNDIPVIVDAAAELPPKKNLWELAQQGSDLVLFSGGKEIRGLQTSGLMVGKRDLIDAAHFHSAPNEGVGRPLKAGKEIVAGMVAALECYLAEDEELRFQVWTRMCDEIEAGLEGIPGIKIWRFQPTQPRVQPPCVPRLKITLDSNAFNVVELIQRFRAGNPSIAVDGDKEGLIFNVQMLRENEVAPVIDCSRRILSSEH